MGIFTRRRGGNGCDGREYGADIRLVAFMQYLRVLLVVGAAALVTRLVMGDRAQAVSEQMVWFPPLSSNLFSTLLLAVVAGTAGRLLRIPSGVMLLPMLAGALLNAGGVMVIELPEWLLAIAYMAIGWQIGLGFDKQIFLWRCARCRRSCCPFFTDGDLRRYGWGLAHYMQIDFLTAYLATSRAEWTPSR